MKWLGGVFIFVASFVLAISFTGLVTLLGRETLRNSDHGLAVIPESDRVVNGPKGVRIMYAGWEPATDTTVSSIRLVIYNGTLLPVSYSAHAPENLWPELRINGREQAPIYGCGTGIQTFYILPGRSAEVIITPNDFTEIPASGSQITAGFYLQSLGSDHSIYTSEPFNLPEEFRRSIQVWEVPTSE
jgi:hypothetical protein